MALDDLPTWREVETIEDFITAVKDTLQYWLLVHTDAETWADQWVAGEPEFMFRETKGELSNNYFSFDWKGAAYEELAREMSAVQCSACGAMALDGEDLWCDCQSDYEDDSECFDEEPQEIVPTDEEIAEYLEEIEYPLSEYIIMRALETKGFQTYSEALEGYISGHVDEMTEAVDRLEDAIYNDNRWEMLTLSREATRIYHVNGDVIRDYGENIGLDYNLVDDVRNDGFAEVFGREEVREFLEG